ncbi:MAG: hypothetical protein V3V23_06845, partial [Dehalococcoidales bacterium]
RPLFFFGIPGIIFTLTGFIAGFQVLDIASTGGGFAAGRAMISVLLLLAGTFSMFTGIILNSISKLRS